MLQEDEKKQNINFSEFFGTILRFFVKVLLLPFYILKFLGCRGIACIGCLGCFGIIFFIAFVVFLIVSKPPSLWPWAVNLVNTAPPKEIGKIFTESSSAILEKQFTNIGENQIELSEDDLNAVIAGFTKNVILNLSPNKITLFAGLDSQIKDTPIWLKAEIPITNSIAQISYLAIGKIEIPYFLHNQLVSILVKFLPIQSEAGQIDIKELFRKMVFKENQNISIDEIKIEDKKIIIKSNLELSL